MVIHCGEPQQEQPKENNNNFSEHFLGEIKKFSHFDILSSEQKMSKYLTILNFFII